MWHRSISTVDGWMAGPTRQPLGPPCWTRSARRCSKRSWASCTRSMRASMVLGQNPYWPIPSGELTFCHGKSPFFMGKSTISMAIFNCYVSSPEGRKIAKTISNFGDGILPYLTYFILICDEYFECLRRLRCRIILTSTDWEPWPMPRLSWIWTGARTAISRGQVWCAEARHHFAFCTRGTAEEVLVLLMAVSPAMKSQPSVENVCHTQKAFVKTLYVPSG